ncbi:hypothetical protein NQ318_020713 [Aromia moschata]|uniref:Chitin-binding type-2 domain-containing protein n=1 Tax=Aromia moschata TaxID=1265417 RepID=A0AAV8YXB0_9CUCU|nr:hypothetical protein NQ318_020713 [Aromia moschata]
MECPKGTLYDSYNELCTSDPVQCPGEPQLACPSQGTFLHPGDCSRYYTCTWSFVYNKFELKQFKCPEKHTYSEQLAGCVRSSSCQASSSTTLDEELTTPLTERGFVCAEPGKFPILRIVACITCVNKSTSQLYEFDEMFGPHISSKNTDVLSNNEEENILGSDNKKMNENDVLDPLENPDVLGQSKLRTHENERRTTFSPTSGWTVQNVLEPLKATDDFTGAPPVP